MSEPLRHSTREHHAPTELYEPDAGSVKQRGHKRKASVPKISKKTTASSSKAKKQQRREPSITPSPSRGRSPAKSKASSSKKKGTKRAASSKSKAGSSKKSKAGTSAKKPAAKKRRTAVHNPRIAAIPNDATSADSEHNTPQHNPKTEAKRMSHYTPSELHQAQHIEESYEAKGMGEKKAKAIAFATVNKLRAQHGETMTSSE